MPSHFRRTLLPALLLGYALLPGAASQAQAPSVTSHRAAAWAPALADSLRAPQGAPHVAAVLRLPGPLGEGPWARATEMAPNGAAPTGAALLGSDETERSRSARVARGAAVGAIVGALGFAAFGLMLTETGDTGEALRSPEMRTALAAGAAAGALVGAAVGALIR